jgi:uncharacterized membrane protein HdeD (DUF308 family)
MSAISDLFLAGMDEVRRSWVWFFAGGTVLILLGVLCVVKAQTATTFSVLVLGWILMFSAVVWFVHVFRAWSWGGVFLYLLNAIVRGVTGFLLVRRPDAGALSVTLVLAALFFIGGLYRIIASSAIKFPRWQWTAIAGAISMALGVYLVSNWAGASTFFIGLAIGIDLIVDGGALVGFAAAIHSLPRVQTRTA